MINLALLLGCLALTGLILQLIVWTTDQTHGTDAFNKFQFNFIAVFLLAMMADWLQGPYVYALYDEYGFSKAEIAMLFVVGFGTSGCMGAGVGAMADRLGRKKACLAYAGIYIVTCLTKHVNNFGVLMFGRFTGGISTSMLFSTFDAWMVHEHHNRKFENSWLNQTFSRATFGNSLVAILAGLVASLLATRFGKVAPFDMSICILSVLAAIILTTWGENYGSSQSAGTSIRQSLQSSCLRMWNDPQILQCGGIQSLFESTMYIFVFMWTPCLPSEINHGLVFACFMTGVIIGSGISSKAVSHNISYEAALATLFGVGAVAIITPAVTDDANTVLLAFIVFEICCGVYFPTYYTLRSIIVPDEGRATILNIFRVPLNAIVVLVCLFAGKAPPAAIFTLCASMMVGGAVCSVDLMFVRRRAALAKGNSTKELAFDEESLGGSTDSTTPSPQLNDDFIFETSPTDGMQLVPTGASIGRPSLR